MHMATKPTHKKSEEKEDGVERALADSHRGAANGKDAVEDERIARVVSPPMRIEELQNTARIQKSSTRVGTDGFDPELLLNC